MAPSLTSNTVAFLSVTSRDRSTARPRASDACGLGKNPLSESRQARRSHLPSIVTRSAGNADAVKSRAQSPGGPWT